MADIMDEAREYLAEHEDACGNENCIGYDAREVLVALLDEVERLTAERRWISVEDGMPPNKEPVFLATFWGGVFEGLWDAAAGEWYMGTTRMPSITHWMPLPEPPEVTA